MEQFSGVLGEQRTSCCRQGARGRESAKMKGEARRSNDSEGGKLRLAIRRREMYHFFCLSKRGLDVHGRLPYEKTSARGLTSRSVFRSEKVGGIFLSAVLGREGGLESLYALLGGKRKSLLSTERIESFACSQVCGTVPA